MNSEIRHLVFPLVKADYLLNYVTGPGVGGDKRKFWRDIMGYQSPEVLRKVLLEQVRADLLASEGRNMYGERYHMIITLPGVSGSSWQIRTCWIVLDGEDVAKFVTAFPERIGRQV